MQKKKINANLLRNWCREQEKTPQTQYGKNENETNFDQILDILRNIKYGSIKEQRKANFYCKNFWRWQIGN